MRPSAYFLAFASFCSPALAQDPPVPIGGFVIASDKDRLTTWSDGYRTRMDAYYPDPSAARPPATGWPAVLVIHGKGGRRGNRVIVRRCTYLARRGYVALAFDVRGDGDTPALNPGRPNGNSSRRILDVAEAYHLAERNLTSLMDDQRLGITGWSMGGGLSLDAASLSEQKIPNIGGGFVTKMPRIGAAVPDIQVLNQPEDYVPGSVMFQAFSALRIYRNNPTGALANAIISGNFPALRAAYEADPVRNRMARLRRADVPLLVCYSHGDRVHFGNHNLDELQTLKPTTPRRYQVTTGGHGTASNTTEDDHEEDVVGRWYDRFLKGRSNGVDQEPAYEAAVPPSSLTAANNAATKWQHRLFPGLRSTTPATRYHLRAPTSGAIGRLNTAPPTSAEGPFTIAHRVRSGYGARNFLQDGGNPQQVNAAVPLVRLRFDLPAAAVEREISGRVVLKFDVQTTIPNIQLSASLFDVPTAGTPRWITSGFAAQRGVTPGTQRFRIELEEIPYVLAAGHRLRLWIHNMPIRFHGAATHYVYVPEFVNEDYGVVTGPTRPAFLDVPWRAGGSHPSLTPRFAAVRASVAIDQPLQIDAGVSRANADYTLLMGISGISPPITNPILVHFRPDVFTDVGLTLLNSVLLPNSFGKLDAQGRAATGLRVSDPVLRSVLQGLRIQFVAGGLASGQVFATTPATVVVDR